MRKGTAYRLAMLGAILLVLANTWVAARSLATMFSAQFWLAHTLEVLAQTEDIALQNRSADASSRGYFLTGDDVFARRYDASSRSLESGIDKLQKLTADNSSQQERIRYLRTRASYKLGAIDAALAVRRSHPDSTVNPIVLQQALSDNPGNGQSVQWCINEMENEEHRLLTQRTHEAAAAKRSLTVTSLAAAVLDLILLIVAFELLLRAERSRIELGRRAVEINALNTELIASNSSLEARVAERTHELQVSNQELEAFSYSVSHDLRAPLRTIDGFSLALKEDFSDKLNDEGQDYIARVRGGVQRMGQLIDALLQLSRVTRSEISRERIDLSQLATNVFNELRAADPERDVLWIAQPGVMVEGDPRLLRIALENLIGNAWKFTSRTADGRIEFGSGTREGHTVYFIRDNGAGFDMQYVDRLFTAFQRLHGDRDFKGSGIGLATVSRIIRRHHGTIGAESIIGQGATFYFTLAA
jgi:signal transduction histidine kinase